MKKIIRACALLFATIVLSACQPTPNEPVVIEKNEENMLQQAQQTKQPMQTEHTTTDAALSLIQQQFIQYSPYQTAFYGNSDAFLVAVDANLSLPDTDAMPIVEVEAKEFPVALIQNIFDYTCNDASMYGDFG